MTVVYATIISTLSRNRRVERTRFADRIVPRSFDEWFLRPVVLILATLSTTSAWAGEVSFEPPSAIVPRGGGVEFAVSVASTDLPSFDSIDLLFSSDLDGLELTFTYDSDFETTLPAPVPSEAMVFPSDLFVGGTNVDGWTAPLMIGTLRVAVGQLSVGVHPDAVQVRPEGEAEVLGTAVSTVGFAETRTTETLSGRLSLTVLNQDSGNDTDPPPDDADPMPTDGPDEPIDTDSDGTADDMDTDDDGDGVEDAVDAFPVDASETSDMDGDGVGNNADPFPVDPMETADSDGDNVGDVADEDDDNDGVLDAMDAFPIDPAESADLDGDGIGDNADAGGANSNTGPTATGGICGFGMIGPSLLLLIGLVGQKIRRKTADPEVL